MEYKYNVQNIYVYKYKKSCTMLILVKWLFYFAKIPLT